MVAPTLPPGWSFLRATLLNREVCARYVCEGAPRTYAELRLTHPDAGAEGARTGRFCVRLLADRKTPSLAALYASLLAAVRAAEPGFTWSDTLVARPSEHPAPSPAPDEPRAPAAHHDDPPPPDDTPPPVEPPPVEHAVLRAARNTFAQGDFDEALDALAAFARDAAAPVAIHDALALRLDLMWQTGRYPEAFAALDEALARFPHSVALHAQATAFHGEMYDDERAVTHARALAALVGEATGPALRAATALLDAGRRDEAKRIADGLRDSAAHAPASLLLDLAGCYLRLDDYTTAEALYAHVLAREPANAAAHLGAGTLCAWRGEAHTARAHAEAALTARPDAPAALCLRGASHMLAGDFARALDDLDRAARLDPGDPVAAVWRGEALLRHGRYAEAVREARRGGVMSVDLSTHIAAQLVIALAQLGEGTFVELLDDVFKPVFATLDDAASPPSDDLTARLEGALARLRGNRSPTATYARADGSLAPLEAPFSPRVAAKRALWRFASTGRTDEALAAFDRIHARVPKTAEPYNYRGEMYLYLGDAAAARREFERAIALYARSRWAYIGLAGAAVLEGDYAQCLAHIEKSVALAGPPGPTAFVYRGEAHRRLGRNAEARADLETCVRAHPQRIGAWVNLGLLCVTEGDLDGARATLATLRQRAPGFVADAARALHTSPAASTDAAALTALFDEMLAMLRGNRGSSCVTYFTREGALRAVSPQTNGGA